MMGSKVGSAPTSYLGLPLGAAIGKKRIWDPIIKRFEKRLVGWKRCYISKGTD